MDRLIIHGPSRLAGEIAAAGAKNAALPALAACLLTDETVTLSRLPEVRDIRTMTRLLEHLGVDAEREDGRRRLTHRHPVTTDDAPYDLVKTMRASVLVLGPLVARLGHARVSLPGGCAIGVRPIDQHLAGLEALGAQVTLEHGYVTARADRLRGARFRFSAPTVGGTENLLMAATLAHGTTVLENCAREPEIRDLATLLQEMGASIRGAGTPTIEVEGVESLRGAEHRILPDRIEVGTYLLAAAITDGRVRITDSKPADLQALTDRLTACGCEVRSGGRWIELSRPGAIEPHDIATAPHPGFATDLQAQYMALMTQARGRSRIRETVFENRFQHVAELNRMGARISVDGREAQIEGPTPLNGARVMATDLRASASLVLAALVADGETVVDRIYHLDRGYERMEEKLQRLGARIERVGGGSV